MAGFPKPHEKRGEVAKRPHPGVPLDPNVIATLITKHSGNVSRIADAMGSTRGCISRVIDKHPELQELLKQSRERQIDELEASCWTDAIQTRDTPLRIFLLKTQAKSRGYETNEAQTTAKDIASAAFAYILDKSKDSSTK